MRVIEPVLIELPKGQILEAIAVLLEHHSGSAVKKTYLEHLAYLCARERDFFIQSGRFYKLLMDSLAAVKSEPAWDEILITIPEFLQEVSRIKNPLTERFLLEIFSIAPMLNPRYLRHMLRASTILPASTQETGERLTAH